MNSITISQRIQLRCASIRMKSFRRDSVVNDLNLFTPRPQDFCDVIRSVLGDGNDFARSSRRDSITRLDQQLLPAGADGKQEWNQVMNGHDHGTGHAQGNGIEGAVKDVQTVQRATPLECRLTAPEILKLGKRDPLNIHQPRDRIGGIFVNYQFEWLSARRCSAATLQRNQ